MQMFTVIGNPIAHSRSPEIHQAFAKQCSISMEYTRSLFELDSFHDSARLFFEKGKGANVTVPFKEQALAFADVLSDAARLAGAVNTLHNDGGTIYGHNTDGIGLVRDIRDNCGVSIAQKKILLLGAGGAARGVVLSLLEEQPSSITVANRTLVRAQQLAETFADHAKIEVKEFSELYEAYDIIINATSASLSQQQLPVGSSVFTQQSLAYDMMYGALPTLFMQSALAAGANACDGLGMLVEQAAESFEIWHGIRPETQPAITKIRKKL